MIVKLDYHVFYLRYKAADMFRSESTHKVYDKFSLYKLLKKYNIFVDTYTYIYGIIPFHTAGGVPALADTR